MRPFFALVMHLFRTLGSKQSTWNPQEQPQSFLNLLQHIRIKVTFVRPMREKYRSRKRANFKYIHFRRGKIFHI